MYSNSRKTNSLKINAFTLIELLVVIAIIALLLSIVTPALRMAKRKAASVVCLSNVKNLSLAWYMYQDEHNGELVDPDIVDRGWVASPERADGTECENALPAPPVTDEDEIRGIEKGMLYPYMKTIYPKGRQTDLTSGKDA